MFWETKKTEQLNMSQTLNQLSLKELLNQVDQSKLPKHIGIIMDGNGRWAEKKGLPRVFGHKQGAESVRQVVECSRELGIKSLTVFAFSTENWKRPSDEVSSLMDLLLEYLLKETNNLHKNNIKINAIGDLTMIPQKCREELNKSMVLTSNNTGMIFNVALNYGGRDEIVRAVKKISTAVVDGQIKVDDITEQVVSDNLYTAGQEELDLLIRPSGELRISNFLLWQLAYAELYYTAVLWPDFSKKDLILAILAYQKRNRRYGNV